MNLYMHLRRSYVLSVLICCLSIGLGIKNCWAWSRHNLINQYVLKEINWLKEYDRITVTPYTYQDKSINPGYKLLYTNPDPDQVNPPLGKFVFYTLDSTEKPGFRGAEIGQKISARQILIDYSDEPDWGMDQNLKLSFMQSLMGGSQGYRHMYYPVWDWHLPYLFFPQGKTPERAEHFYTMAKQALAKGDLYWTFRFLSWVVHLVGDMGQPYHTTQTSLSFISLSSFIKTSTQTTKNYHFAYESYINYRLQLEAGGLISPDYISVLEQAPALKVSSLTRLVKDMAQMNNKKVGETFQASINFFGKRLRSPKEVVLGQDEVDVLMTSPQRSQFDHTARQALKLTSDGVRGVLEYIKTELFNK